ncbi:MAG: hypothetical protein IKT10_03650 [Clostridiales bacterium]|nr:hypothetical protein [Clostridiales bacterium]
MAHRKRNHHFTHVIALMILSSVLFCACEAISIEPSKTTESTETEITLLPDSSNWSFEVEGSEATTTTTAQTPEETDEEDPEDTETSSDPDATTETTAEPTFVSSSKELGSGPYTFMRGSMKFHSQTDISMMIKPEDGSVYDFGARDCQCSWIDTFYLKDTYKMKAYDATYRWLGYYNKDFSISFKTYKEIGKWKSPKGNDYTLYLVEILIISHNMEIRILPKETNELSVYNVSINGRGYYASEEQLQMMDFVLSALTQKPYIDPLEGIYTGTDHKYYF